MGTKEPKYTRSSLRIERSRSDEVDVRNSARALLKEAGAL